MEFKKSMDSPINPEYLEFLDYLEYISIPNSWSACRVEGINKNRKKVFFHININIQYIINMSTKMYFDS